MLRPIFAFSALALTATAATAANARDIIWTCGPDACQGATAESRPIVLCEGLAKKAGRIDSFLVDGRALSAAELDRCNAAAKAQPAKALAAQ
jgi:hypothetical protein